MLTLHGASSAVKPEVKVPASVPLGASSFQRDGADDWTFRLLEEAQILDIPY